MFKPFRELLSIAVWQALPQWFPTIELDEFVVMPNHVHFVVWILDGSVGIPLAGILDAGVDDTTGTGASPVPTSFRNRIK